MVRFAGYVIDHDKAAPPSLLKKMGAVLAIDPAYRLSFYENHGTGIAICDHLFSASTPAQVVWNEDQTRWIALAGEIFDYQGWQQKLIERGHKFNFDSGYRAQAEFVLHLYEELGDPFALELNGSFALAIYDTKQRQLCLVNGRLGVRPLYFSQHNGRFLFGSSVSALLADEQLPRTVDKVAIAELLTYEYALNEHTLLESVQLLPPATILTWREGAVTLKPYWQLRFAESSEVRPYADYLGDLIAHLRQAMKRQLPNGLAAGINLSGGFDSRVALGLLNEQRKQATIHAYTFGIPGCDDVRIATELAQTLQIEHTVYLLNPAYLIEQAELGVRLTDGMESCIHMHALANTKQQANQVQLLYTGYILDSIISPDASENWLAHYNDDDAAKLLHGDIWASLKSVPLADAFSDSFWQSTEKGYQASFRQAMAGSRQYLLSDWQNRFELLQRQRRFTQLGNELLNNNLVCRTPFADKDLVDFCLALPPGHRLERKILRDIIVYNFHPLAKIPLDKTGYPLVTCLRDLQLRTLYQAKWLLINNGLIANKEKPLRPYADYNLWLRNELRGWMEGILLDKRTLERGYLKPAAIRKLVSDHVGGAKYAKELGMLISIELWQRMYLD